MSDDPFAQRLAAEGLVAGPWSNGPGDRYAAHAHGYDKVLGATTGSITFHVSDAGTNLDVELDTGDRLNLPANTSHAATVGSRGVRCLEAHLPAGSLGPLAVYRAGDW